MQESGRNHSFLTSPGNIGFDPDSLEMSCVGIYCRLEAEVQRLELQAENDMVELLRRQNQVALCCMLKTSASYYL